MKKVFSVSLLVPCFFLLLICTLIMISCGKNSEEIRKEARQTVSDYKEMVTKYENWVQTKAEYMSPVIESHNSGWLAKIDTTMNKWEDNKGKFKENLSSEEYSKLEDEIKSFASKITGINQVFLKKYSEIQGQIPVILDEDEEDTTDN